MSAPFLGPISPRGGLPGSSQVQQLARDLHKVGPAGRKALAKRFRSLGGPLLSDARRRAGWSTRIPGSLSIRAITNATTGRIGLQLRQSAKQAPHGRPYEGISNQGNDGYFRHPVFGSDEWVSTATRPYAWPAVVAMGGDARREVAAAAEDAFREAGFR